MYSLFCEHLANIRKTFYGYQMINFLFFVIKYLLFVYVTITVTTETPLMNWDSDQK